MAVTFFARSGTRTSFLNVLLSTITHIGTGDDNTAPTVTDTSLGNETVREAVFDSGISGTGVFFQMFQDTADNNGFNIEEEGLFDALSGGTLYTHNLTNVIIKNSSTEVFIENKINESVDNV
jgi:hypothetical protein